PQALLALGVALCPAIAATDSKLPLPAGLFFWAGVIGLWLGLRAGRPATDHRPFDPSTALRGAGAQARPFDPSTALRGAGAQARPFDGAQARQPNTDRSRDVLRSTPEIVRLACWLALVLAFAALLAIAAGQALPPLGLITQDSAAWIVWAVALLRHSAALSDMPPGRVWEFLSASLPRFWHGLTIAPNDGEPGAQLLVAVCGAVAPWIAAPLLGLRPPRPPPPFLSRPPPL